MDALQEATRWGFSRQSLGVPEGAIQHYDDMVHGRIQKPGFQLKNVHRPETGTPPFGMPQHLHALLHPIFTANMRPPLGCLLTSVFQQST